jgi:hypothetical protein
MLKHPARLINSQVERFLKEVPPQPIMTIWDRTRRRRALAQTQADDNRIAVWKEERR